MSRPRPFCLLFNLMKGAFTMDDRLHSRHAELEAEAKRRGTDVETLARSVQACARPALPGTYDHAGAVRTGRVI
jgi:hypothetical protein